MTASGLETLMSCSRPPMHAGKGSKQQAACKQSAKAKESIGTAGYMSASRQSVKTEGDTKPLVSDKEESLCRHRMAV
eukprot:1149064-Pelagomonas_calceolata.AAC.4